MAEVHDCFTPTELVLRNPGVRLGTPEEVLAGTSISTASSRSTRTAA